MVKASGGQEEGMYWVYILLCSNDSYYTGITTDLARRFHEHQIGSDKCKYTRSFKPLGIAQSWKIRGDKAAAMKIEKYIKTFSKKEKERLIHFPTLLADVFECILENGICF